MEMGGALGGGLSIWRAGGKWTPAEDAQILLWRAEGLSLTQMADRTGGRRQVYSISDRMNLLRREHERDGVPFPELPPKRSGRTPKPLVRPASPAWSEAELADLKRIATRTPRQTLIVTQMRALWPARTEHAIRRKLIELPEHGALVDGRDARMALTAMPDPHLLPEPHFVPAREPTPGMRRLIDAAGRPLPGVMPLPLLTAQRGRDCHWVVDLPGAAGAHVCGAPLADGHKSYCAAHAARARGTGPESPAAGEKEGGR